MIKFKGILSEIGTDVKKAFGDIAFGDEPEFVRIQGKYGLERDTEIEEKILMALQKWVGAPNNKSSEYLYNHIELFKKAKNKFPSIFKPETPNGTDIYRGINKVNDEIISSLKKNSKPKDYTKLTVRGVTFYKYNKPILYTPNRNIQSWTSTAEISVKFSYGPDKDNGGIIISNQNDEYFFNQNVTNYLFGETEDEILHFGKSYSNPVFLALNPYLADHIFSVTSKSKKRIKDIIDGKSKPEFKYEVDDVMEALGIKDYTVNTNDLTVYVHGNLNIQGKGLRKIPVQLQFVVGDFNCSNNQLTTLEGAPRTVGGDFNCSNNQLTTLEDAPKKVGRHFRCGDNQLTTLEGAPQEVFGNFVCINNRLTSLKGAPLRVGGNFWFSGNVSLSQSQKDWAEKNIKARDFIWE
jgi:hypothetical protein